MAVRKSGAKFIRDNNAPRVQIETDVLGVDGQKAESIPFVMGVMADLSGASSSELKDINDRAPVSVDAESFDEFLKKQKPTVRFAVPNTLSGGGDMGIELTFESMDDFSPGAIARKVEPLRKLLESRERLQNLKLWCESNRVPEGKLTELLGDEAALKALMSSAPPPDGGKSEA